VQRREIVTIALAHVEAESFPLQGEGLERKYVFGATEALDTICIDQDRNVVEAMVPGKQGRFPSGAFIALAVGEQAGNTRGLLTQKLVAVCHADCDRQPMAERTRGGGNGGDA